MCPSPLRKYALRKCKAAKWQGDYWSDRLCDWPAADTTNHSSSHHHQHQHHHFGMSSKLACSSNIPTAPTAGHVRLKLDQSNSDEMNVTSEEVRFNFWMGDWEDVWRVL